MSQKSDISDIVLHILSVNGWQSRPPLSSLLALLQDESVFSNMEAIDLNSILRSAPEISKEQEKRIKLYKRSLRKRAAKKAFIVRENMLTTQLDLELDALYFQKRALLKEIKDLEREIREFEFHLTESHH